LNTDTVNILQPLQPLQPLSTPIYFTMHVVSRTTGPVAFYNKWKGKCACTCCSTANHRYRWMWAFILAICIGILALGIIGIRTIDFCHIPSCQDTLIHCNGPDTTVCDYTPIHFEDCDEYLAVSNRYYTCVYYIGGVPAYYNPDFDKQYNMDNGEHYIKMSISATVISGVVMVYALLVIACYSDQINIADMSSTSV
jgi:hypothetical protein